MPVQAKLRAFLDSSQVIRYRVVSVDIPWLWSFLETARDLEDFDDQAPIEFSLFEDLSLNMRLTNVHHRYWTSHAIFVTTRADYDSNPDSNVFARFSLNRGESLTATFYVAGDQYAISLIEKGPYHVITQLNAEEMPNLD